MRFVRFASLFFAGLTLVVPVLAETAPATSEASASVPVEVYTLDNGMEFLLVPKPEMTTIVAGWVARVGSANERPGITGISHLFEHMMFKGSHAIGTTDIARDLEIIDEQERLQEQIRQLYREQRERYRRGEIDDPFDPDARPEELIALEAEFQKLIDEQRELMIKDEFDKIYTKAGGSRMNAFTNNDMTVYFITVPANKAELWFWMESDRLTTPVFREFYAERDVVYEERRLRTESTPTGKFDEQFDAMFWQSHPYSWPVIGWPSDLEVISKEQADQYFETFYSANNLLAAVVGNFDVDEVKALANKYFGRLKRSDKPLPDVPTLEMDQLAEKRMVAECDCQPQIEVRYHSVPFMHKDSYALDVLSGLMNGRTGRLYKKLVLEDEIASSAFAAQSSNKYAGYMSFGGQTKGDSTPEQLEAAWYAELQRLIDEPIADEELQKVKNQIAASAFRRLGSPFFLMIQLLVYEGLGDWNYINDWSKDTLAVTADDVKRVAKKYMTKENRAVALYYRKAGTEAEEMPEGFAELEPQQQEMVRAQLQQIKSFADASQLEAMLGQMEQQKASVPPEFHAAMDVVAKGVRARIEALKSAGTEKKEGE